MFWIDTDSRALWKIISSGLGIESEIVAGEKHAFLKINDIEVEFANGEKARGNTILDPTWNLDSHRFGWRPNNFFMSYEEARKHDIDAFGNDHKCHQNDKDLSDATLKLDEQSVRKLFASVGLASEKGEFPIKKAVVKKQIIARTVKKDEYYK